VVTVVRNGEKTLEETILSVINQIYNNVEYIIVDGASTDGTLDIIRKYEERIDYWISEPDAGIYDAMNKGIDLAAGQWINFMNSGDGFYEYRTINKIASIITSIDSKLLIGKAYIKRKQFDDIDRPKFNKKNIIDHFCHQACFFYHNNLVYDTRFKICSDRALIRKYHFDEILLVDHIICNYDITGISSKSYYLRMKETMLIDGKNLIQIRCVILYIRYVMVSIIKYLLPAEIVKQLEKRNNE
jgi:glycosyltransferase involved in cell wall biosynthesis